VGNKSNTIDQDLGKVKALNLNTKN